MRVLIVGAGGREHALAWRLSSSPQVTEILTAPGNSGTAGLGENLPIADDDLDGILAAAESRAADLVVVGPEIPLAMGLADRLTAAGIPAFGPSQAAAQLEASKSFARDVMAAADVPGPAYRVFQSTSGALEYIATHDRPVVVKADGLAAGKGVAMCASREAAQAAVHACMNDRVFGASGDTIVIEDWMDGPEVSVFGFTDGANLSAVAAATDYKRIGVGGTGANTGGMGSYGPPHFWNDEWAEVIRTRFMLPVLHELAERGCAYRGALYCGLMLTNAGPRVLEFNCRFGDPETQVIMPQLLSDPAPLMLACATGSLADVPAVQWSNRPTVGVVMVSGGYPGPYETGHPISGLNVAVGETLVFHAGARLDDNGVPTTAGGRVLTCVGAGDTVAEARHRAYRRAAAIGFSHAYYRTDIADVGQPQRLSSSAPPMTASTARTRSQPDWSALAASYHAAATADALASYRRRRWNFADQPQEWLTQGQLPSLTEAQALTLYRAAGGRHTAQFRTNPIAEVRDAADFLLYDTIKLESRFDECASPEGGFGLNGAGREWPSYLLTLHEPALFAPWSPHTERGLRRLGMFPAALKRGHVGLCYLEMLDILEYLRARLGLPDFRAVDEFCYLNGRTQRTAS